MKVSSEIKITIKTSILSAIFTVVLLMLVNYFFNHSWNFFLNSQVKTQTLKVQGTGTVSATPDQGDISFTVSKTGTTLQETQKVANTSMDKITSDLQQLNIAKKDIQTSNYNSSPNYDDNGTTIINYTVSEDVDVTTHDTTKAEKIIDAATKDGAEDISGPNMSFSDALQQKLTDEARIKAIANAKEKAQSIAKAAGIHLGSVVNVEDNEATPMPIYPIHPVMLTAKSASSMPNIPTQINPGQNTVTANVTLSYQTY
jgi:uncharacterized protein